MYIYIFNPKLYEWRTTMMERKEGKGSNGGNGVKATSQDG